MKLTTNLQTYYICLTTREGTIIYHIFFFFFSDNNHASFNLWRKKISEMLKSSKVLRPQWQFQKWLFLPFRIF